MKQSAIYSTQKYQIPCNGKQDSTDKLKLILANGGKLVKNNRDANGFGTIAIEIKSDSLKKELRQKLGLFRVKVTDVNDRKLEELKEKFPTATIEPDQEKSILVTGDIDLKKDLELVVNGWAKTNPEDQDPVTPSQEALVPPIPDESSEKKDPLKRKLQSFYQEHSNIPTLIKDEDIKEQSIKDCYISLKILIKDDKALEDLGQISDDNYHLLGDKKPISVEDIFAPLQKDQKPVSKVIIIGRAGIGKTTLMQYIAYKWGEGNKSDYNRFDYLFQIRLKDLIDDEWRQNYGRDELNQNPLACFIHAHLNRDFRSEFKLEDIVRAISDQEKVLLLLDGYDEAAVRIASDNLASDIFNQALKYQNIIMTSRPNVLSDKVSSNFERVIENAGLDEKGIESYIDLNFTGSNQLKLELKLFLLQNPVVKSMCSTPINVAILCLVWAKDELVNIKKISTDFNLGLLYEKIIILLAKRYLSKFQLDKTQATELINISDQQITALPIIRFLQAVSYQSFITCQTIISSKLIKQELSKIEYQELTIEAIGRYGLLKPDTEGKKVIDVDHSFLHLTFLEYFTARQLTSYLASPDQDMVRKTADLIALNRNQARYLLVLKFMAGMVSADKSESASILITRFWEIVTCNIDGIIELEAEPKATLFMHLLAQGQIEGKADSRIPNLNQIKEFIDEAVISDLVNFSDKIIYSGYISEKILNKILSIITNAESAPKSKAANFQEVKAALATLPTIASKYPKIRQELVRKLLLLLRSDDWLLKKHVAEIIPDIALTNIDSELQKQIISDLILAIKDDQEIKQNVDLTKSLITTLATISVRFGLSIETLELIIFFASDKNIFAQIGHEALIKAAGTMPITELFELIKPLLSSQGKWQVRDGAAFYLSQIVAINPKLADETFLLLTPLISDEAAKVRIAASNAIAKIAKTIPKYTDQAFELLTPLISDQDLDVRANACISIKAIVTINHQLASKALLLVKNLLLCNKNSWRLFEIANSYSLELIDFVTPNEALRLVKIFLRKESDFEIQLGNLIKTLELLKGITMDGVEPPIKKAVCDGFNIPDIETLILALTEIRQTSEGTNHSEIRKKIKEAGNIDKLLTKISKRLGEDNFNLLLMYRGYSDKMSPFHSAAFSYQDVDINNLKKVAIKSLAKIARLDPRISDRCVEIIIPFIDESSGCDIRDAAKEGFCEIIKSVPGIKALEFLTNAFASTNYTVCDAGANALFAKVTSDPDFAKKASKLIIPILHSRITFSSHEANQAISEIAKAMTIDDLLEMVKLIVLQASYLVTGGDHRSIGYFRTIINTAPTDKILKLVKLLRTINHPEIQKAVSIILSSVKNSETQTQDLELIKLQLQNQKPYEREDIIKNLLSLVKTNPELAANILAVIEPYLTDNTDFHGQGSIALLMTEIIKLIPANRALEVVRKLFSSNNETLKKHGSWCGVHSDDKVVYEYQGLKTHIAVLKQTLETHPELTFEVLELVKSLIKKKKSGTRSNGAAIIYHIAIIGLTQPSQAVELIAPLLLDPNPEVKKDAATCLSEIVSFAPEVSDQVQKLITPLYHDDHQHIEVIISKIIEQTVKTDPLATAKNLQKIIDSAPKLAAEVLRKIVPFRYRDDKDLEDSTLVKVIKANHEIAIKVWEIIKPIFASDYKTEWQSIDHAIDILSEIITAAPTLTTEAWQVIKPVIATHNWLGLSTSKQFMSQIINAAPEIASEVLEIATQLPFETYQMSMSSIGDDYSPSNDAIEQISKIVTTNPELAIDAFNLFKTRLEKKGYETRAIIAMLSLVKINPDLIQEFIILVRPFINHQNHHLRSTAACCILELGKTAPNLILELIDIIKPTFLGQDIETESLSRILELVSSNPNMADLNQEMIGLVGSATRNSDIKIAIIHKMSELIDVDPILMTQSSKLIEPFLTFNAEYDQDTLTRNHIEQYTRDSAFYFFSKLAKVICKKQPDQISLVAVLLIHPNHQIRNNTIEILLEFLLKIAEEPDLDKVQIIPNNQTSNNVIETLLESLSKDLLSENDTQTLLETLSKDLLPKIEERPDLNKIQIIKIIAAISYYNDEIAKQIGTDDQEIDTQNAKKLLPVILTKQINDIDDQSLQHLVENFDDLVTNPQMRICLKKLYHQILKQQSTGNNNEIQTAFITRCIEYHFVSYFDGNNHRIIFDNQSYQLQAGNNPLKFEDLVQVGLNIKKTTTSADHQTLQPDLKTQYVTHQPLFTNSQLAIRIAACDIDQVLSLFVIDGSVMDSKNLLSAKFWQLSLVSNSDNATFLLVQGRNIFGNVVIYQLSLSPDQLIETYISHPLDIDRKLREKIFGQIDYDQSEQLYYVTNIAISNQQLAELVTKFRPDNPELLEIAEAGALLQFQYLSQIMLDLDLQSLTNLSQSQRTHLALPWDKYIEQEDTIKLSQVQLLTASSKSNAAKQGQDLAAAFRAACRNGNLHIAEDLLSTNPEILNSQDRDGNTGLHFACQGGHKEIVEFLLLSTDIDYNAQNNDGFTCLLIASQKGYIPIVDLLLKKGANPDIADLFDKRPIDLVGAKNLEIFELLRCKEGLNLIKDKITNQTAQNIESQESLKGKIAFNPIKIEALNKSYNPATDKLELKIKVTFSYNTKKNINVSCEIIRDFNIGGRSEDLKDDLAALDNIDKIIDEIIDDTLELIAPQLQIIKADEEQKAVLDRLSVDKLAKEISELRSDITSQISKLDQKFEQVISNQENIEALQEKIAQILLKDRSNFGSDNLATTLFLYLETLDEIYSDQTKTLEQKIKEVAKRLPSHRSFLKNALRDEEKKLSKYHSIREKKSGQLAEESAKQDSIIESRINEIKTLLTELESAILEQQKIVFKQIQKSFESDKQDPALTRDKRQALAIKLSDLRNIENILTLLSVPIIKKPAPEIKLPKAQTLEKPLYLLKTKATIKDIELVLSQDNLLRYTDEQLIEINGLFCSIDDETQQSNFCQQFVDTASAILISSTDFSQCARRIAILMTKLITENQRQQLVENICNSYNQITGDNLVKPAKFIEETELLLKTASQDKSADSESTINWTEMVGRKQTAEQKIIREFLVEITNKGDFHPILISQPHSKHNLSDPSIMKQTADQIIAKNLTTTTLQLKEIFGEQFCLTDEVVRNIIQVIAENFSDHTEKRNRGSHNFCILIPKIFPNPKSTLNPEQKEKYLQKFKELAIRIKEARENPQIVPAI
jgi:hypothetical protein